MSQLIPIMAHVSNSTGYIMLVREAHELADLLKRVKPQLHDQVSELQGIVTRAHQKLEALDKHEQQAQDLDHQQCRQSRETASQGHERNSILTELEAALHSLQELKRHKVRGVVDGSPPHKITVV